MFGDYGHGSLLLFISLIQIFFHNSLNKGAGKEVQKLRYLLLGFGVFSCYHGLLYNAFFEVPNDWFGSCYDVTKRPIAS